MSPVICNTSPLYYLHQLGLLELLPGLFESVWVPDAVCQELEQGEKAGFKIPAIDQKSWVQRKSIVVPKILNDIDGLGNGEKEVLALGLVHKSALLILDDLLARTVAERYSFNLIGTLGVLLASKKQGRLALLSPILDQLVELKFRLSPELRTRVLFKANEI